MKGLTKLLAAVPLVLATGTWSWISTVHAHEFIVKPQQLRVESGAKLPFNILATHFFMISEEVEPVNTVKVWAVEGEKRTAIELKENHMLQTLDGVAPLNRKGTS
jgi:NADPH:quinone reductase-like Zn-dependent oxidoreductase